MYFKTSGQKLFGRNLGCYLHYFQYQMRCYGVASLNFQTQKSEKAPIELHLFDVLSINILQ